jgi:hypothetical protein
MSLTRPSPPVLAVLDNLIYSYSGRTQWSGFSTSEDHSISPLRRWPTNKGKPIMTDVYICDTNRILIGYRYAFCTMCIGVG